MPRYEGLDVRLRQEVLDRDGHRCRWCGATNRGADLHHIEYRRGFSYDRADNLISLCRLHHGFVHGIPLANGDRIVKSVAQLILKELVATPGVTGAALWRSHKARWVREGRCTTHGLETDMCLECR